MTAKKNPQPAPVVVTTICSMCGMDWTAHGDAPTTVDCIRLLKAEIARRLAIASSQPLYPRPYVWPYMPYMYGTTYCQSNTASINLRSPEISNMAVTQA